MKGILDRPHILDAIERGLERERVVLLVGKPRLGKSISLLLLAERLNAKSKKHITLSVSPDQSKINFIAELTSLLMGEESGARTLSELLEYWNSSQSIVLLDGFELLKDGHDLLQHFSENLTTGSLVLASRRLPNLSPIELAQLRIVRLQNFEKEESSDLVSLFIDDLPPPLFKQLAEELKGRPEQIRYVCGLIKMSDSSLDSEKLASFCEDSKRDSQIKLFSRLSQSLKVKLLAASNIRIDKKLVNDIVEGLRPEEIVELQDLAWLTSDAKTLMIDLGEIPDSSDQQILIDSSRSFALLLLEKSERDLSVFERVYLLKQKCNFAEAAKLLNENLKLYATELNAPDLLLLTDELTSLLSGYSWYKRSMAHRLMGLTHLSTEELETLNLLKFDSSEKVYINYARIKNDEFLRKKSNADILLEYQKNTSVEDFQNEAWCRSKLRTFNLAYDLGNKLFARDEISKFRVALKQNSPQPLDLLLDAAQMASTMEEGLGYIKKSLEILDEARFFSKNQDDLFGHYWLKLIALDTKNVLAPCPENQNHLRQANHEVSKLGLPYLVRYGTLCESRVDRESGRPLTSIARLRPYALGESLNYEVLIFELMLSYLTSSDSAAIKALFERIRPYLDRYNIICRSQFRLIGSAFQISDAEAVDFWTKESLKWEQFEYYGVFSVFLELNWHFYLGASTHDFSFEIPPQKGGELDSIRCFVQMGWIHLIHDRDFVARDSFESGLKLASPSGLHLHTHRSQSGLAVLDMKSGDFNMALSRLRIAAALENEMDPILDLELNSLLTTACLIKLQNTKDASEQLKRSKLGGRYDYLRYLLCVELRLNDYASKPVVSDGHKSFCEKLAKKIGIQTIRRLESRDESGRRLVGDESTTIPKNKDFVWSRLKGELRGASKTIEVRDKPQIQELLYFFCCRPGQLFTKEQIIGIVWKETYNPLVHDSRVYTGVKRIRQLLSEFTRKEAIIQEGGKYGVHPMLKFTVISLEEDDLGINDRQKWILEFTDQDRSIDRQTAENVLKVSATQIKRDLKELVDRGMLQVEGAARATRYVRGSGANSKKTNIKKVS